MSWITAPIDADWQAVVDMLTSGEPVLLLAHVAPDADAVGSALAVGIALDRLGVDVRVSFGDDPFEIPRVLRGLPGQCHALPRLAFGAAQGRRGGRAR